MAANICVYADSKKSKPIAIIVPAEPALRKAAHEHGVEGTGIEDPSHNGKPNKILLKEIQATGRNSGLQGIEIIDGLVMADEEWNPANVS